MPESTQMNNSNSLNFHFGKKRKNILEQNTEPFKTLKCPDQPPKKF